MKLLLLLVFFVALLSACHSSKGIVTSHSSGFLIRQYCPYDFSEKIFFRDSVSYPDAKIWYRDSTVIEEIVGVNMYDIDTGGQHREWRELVPLGFIYIDVPTRSFYHYLHMNDTALVQKAYIQPDSLGLTGGWAFYIDFDKSSEKKLTRYEDMSDTLIKGVVYKRAMVSFTSKNQPNRAKTGIFLGRCDKRGTMFQTNRLIAARMGCPVIAYEAVINENAVDAAKLEIDFVRDSLTAQEIKVFDTWERYAKSHPIRKSNF